MSTLTFIKIAARVFAVVIFLFIAFKAIDTSVAYWEAGAFGAFAGSFVLADLGG